MADQTEVGGVAVEIRLAVRQAGSAMPARVIGIDAEVAGQQAEQRRIAACREAVCVAPEQGGRALLALTQAVEAEFQAVVGADDQPFGERFGKRGRPGGPRRHAARTAPAPIMRAFTASPKAAKMARAKALVW